jgi:predicted nucleotidyltransferase
MHPLIHEHRNAIAELCQRYRVQRLEVFGSAARGTDFDPETSDADFLVEFSTASDSPSLKAFFGLQTDLSKVLGRTVDLAEASAAWFNRGLHFRKIATRPKPLVSRDRAF